MERFREELVSKAHRLLYHSTLGSRVMKCRRRRGVWPARLASLPSPLSPASNQVMEHSSLHLSLSLAHTHTLTYTCTHTHTHTYTHTHTHTHTHSACRPRARHRFHPLFHLLQVMSLSAVNVCMYVCVCVCVCRRMRRLDRAHGIASIPSFTCSITSA